MTDKIMLDGVSGLNCSDCPEKERCKEQQDKAIIPALNIIDYIRRILISNHCEQYIHYLEQLEKIIPRPTRCDTVLEKQLQRKKNVIEALKKAVLLKENNRYIQACLVAAKQEECEKLKTTLMQKDEVNTFFNTPLEGWSSDPCGICQYKNEYNRYKQVLEKIKEIALSTLDCGEWIGQGDNKIEEIIHIINRVKNG